MLLAIVLLALNINELMYNPSQCSDSYCEWIEIYNDGDELSLENATLCGAKLINGFVNHSDNKVSRNFSYIIPSKGFGIVTDGGTGTDVYNFFEVNNGSTAFHVNANSICGELANNGGLINFTLGSFTQIVEYSSDKANGNGKTIEWSESYWGESLVSGGTSGNVNSIKGLSNDASVLKITEFMPDPKGDDDAEMPLGEWIELYNLGQMPFDARSLIIKDNTNDNEIYISDTNTNGTIISSKGYMVVFRNKDSDFSMNNNGYDEVRLFDGDELIDLVSYSGSSEGLSWSKTAKGWKETLPTLGFENNDTIGCDWKVEIKTNGTLFNSSTDFDVKIEKIFGADSKLSVRGFIEDVFGSIIKEYNPFTNESISLKRTASYSPNLKEGIYVARFWLAEKNCNDINMENDVSEKLIAVSPKQKSSNAILSIKADDASNGIAEVEITASRGNSTKSVIELWVEDDGKKVGKITKVKISDDVSVTIPLKLPDKEGKYTIVAEGLGLKEETEVKSKGKRAAIEIENMPPFAYIGKAFYVEASVSGSNKVMWYLYKGKKKYSDIKELNIAEDEIVKLPVQVSGDAEPGNYKIKITSGNKEVTEDIEILEKEGKILDLYYDNSLVVKANAPGQTLELFSFMGKQEKAVEKEETKFNVTLLEGDNLFFAKLTDEEKDVTDFSQINLKFNGSKVISQQHEIVENNIIKERLKNINKGKPGMVVYESNSWKAKGLAPYFMVLAFGILSMILILTKKL